ncbi:helix-turn-helix domain-containing protein [Lentzea sp. NPDC055074]
MELLADEAPFEDIEKVVQDARRNGAGGRRLENLDSAARTALRIQEKSQRRRGRESGLSAVLDAAREFATAGDLDTLLQTLTRRARLLLGVDMSYVSLLEDDSEDGHAVIRAADGHTSTLSVGLRLPRTGGLGNLVVTDRAPFWTRDYLRDDQIRHDEQIDEVVRAEGLNAMMAVPLSHETGVFGTLYVAERKVRPFSADERSLLGSLGVLAGAAIENVRRLDLALARQAELTAGTAAVKRTLSEAREIAEFRQRQIELVLRSGDLQVLLDEASTRLPGHLHVRAPGAVVLAAVGPVPDCDETQLMRAMMTAHTEGGPVQLESGPWVAPVQAGADHLGIILHWPEKPPNSHERQLVSVVAEAAALVLRPARNASTHDVPGTDELLDDLVSGRQRSLKRLGQRAVQLGFDLSRPHVVVVARPETKVSGKLMVWASSYAQRQGGLTTVRDGLVVLLVPGDDPSAAAGDAAEEVASLMKTPVTISAAGPADGADAMPGVYQEARRCLDAMVALGLTGGASSPAELGFLGVLLSDDQDMDGFVTSTLGPVIEHDRDRASELLRTLDAYFATGSSPTRAAERLHVHPNTVARRLERIGELLGPAWQEPEKALNVHLALRLVRIQRIVTERRR